MHRSDENMFLQKLCRNVKKYYNIVYDAHTYICIYIISEYNSLKLCLKNIFSYLSFCMQLLAGFVIMVLSFFTYVAFQ